MSNLIKRLGKNLKISNLIFPVQMYNNIFGSIIVCAYIFTMNKSDINLNDIKKKWTKVSKNPKRFIRNIGLTDKSTFQEIIDQTLKYFNVKKPSLFKVALVQSNLNSLFAPYDGKQIYPLREDGFCGITLRTGAVHPIE